MSAEVTTPERKWLTRADLLAPPSLDEKVVSFAGWGDVLCGELSGDDRAAITEKLAKSSQDGEVDLRGYQRKLLALGLLDPESAADARVPLLRDADVASFMGKLGGGKVRDLVETIESLSGMSAKATEDIKGNSEAPSSDGGTSV